MTVKTAALPRQRLERRVAAVPGRWPHHLIAFVALIGVVELVWVILLAVLVGWFV